MSFQKYCYLRKELLPLVTSGSGSVVTFCLFTQPNTPVSHQSFWLTSIVSMKKKETNRTLPNALNSMQLTQLTQPWATHATYGKAPKSKDVFSIHYFSGKRISRRLSFSVLSCSANMVATQIYTVLSHLSPAKQISALLR